MKNLSRRSLGGIRMIESGQLLAGSLPVVCWDILVRRSLKSSRSKAVIPFAGGG